MKKVALKVIRFYQLFISPYLGFSCRFYPSCSEYSRQAVIKYGLLNGVKKGLRRFLRCGPWTSVAYQGKVDLP